MVRPEHANLASDGAAPDLTGVLENVVYFGTDTHYHIRLDSGEPFIVRRQNSRGPAAAPEVGAPVGVTLGQGAAQVLKD